MKYINQLIGELMPSKKRGSTKFVNSNHVKHAMRYELQGDV